MKRQFVYSWWLVVICQCGCRCCHYCHHCRSMKCGHQGHESNSCTVVKISCIETWCSCNCDCLSTSWWFERTGARLQAFQGGQQSSNVWHFYLFTLGTHLVPHPACSLSIRHAWAPDTCLYPAATGYSQKLHQSHTSIPPQTIL